MVKLSHQWEGPPDHHEGYPSESHQKCSSVEGEHNGPQCQSKQSLPLGLQSRYTIEIEEGEQESQFPPAFLACTSSQR